MVSVPILFMIAVFCLAIGVVAGMAIRSRAATQQSCNAAERTVAVCSLPSGNDSHDISACSKAAPDAVARLAGNLPVPDNELIQFVTPSFGLAQFLRTGAEVADFLYNLLRRNGVPLYSLRAILDFGCGCGRVLRHFPSFGLKDLKVYGSDYNPYLIDWCKRNLRFAEFEVNNLEPPLNYRDGIFDFVYAISVFTHLNETLQFAWLDEMVRILRPGGYLLITVHGSAFAMDLDETQRRQFQLGQLVVKNAAHVGKNFCGAYHPVQYIKEKFTYAFDILEIIEQTEPRWQDAYLFRKTACKERTA